MFQYRTFLKLSVLTIKKLSEANIRKSAPCINTPLHTHEHASIIFCIVHSILIFEDEYIKTTIPSNPWPSAANQSELDARSWNNTPRGLINSLSKSPCITIYWKSLNPVKKIINIPYVKNIKLNKNNNSFIVQPPMFLKLRKVIYIMITAVDSLAITANILRKASTLYWNQAFIDVLQ